ncbi:MAG: Xaa-Pro peptidase family protein [Clostridiales bacterium]|nr:Xaa-Pro peptidase family protein [Clostridiales bacterium]
MMQLLLLDKDEQARRVARLVDGMAASGIDALLLADNASKFYLTGRVFAGYVYIRVDGSVMCTVQRPVELSGDEVKYIHKPEELPAIVGELPARLGLELDTMSYNMVERLKAVFHNSEIGNASALMRRARSVKTQAEVKQIALSGIKQERVYRRIPHLYNEGMTDIEFQVEIERTSRLEGCLGQFRINGDSMELFMANVITGDNADEPSPYDFAMGGAGMSASLPVGANGTEIKPGMVVMVDANGNYTGYMTDMTRIFSLGNVSPLALKAHECSRRIHRELCQMGKPGVEARTLYEHAMAIVKEEGLEHLFMGHRQHAKFIGHGVGIEINELPVIAPRCRDVIEAGQVIALEPKFVIPGVGAVGVENTYHVKDDGEWECLTNAPEEIISLR